MLKIPHVIRLAWLMVFIGCLTAEGQQPFSPPTLNNLSVTGSVVENGTATLTGTIVDSIQSAFTLAINWGDVPAVQLVQLPAGATGFSVNHQYLDNHQPGTSFTPLLVNVTLTDAEGANNQDFLSAIFQDLLGRAASPSETTFYLNYLSQSGTRSGIVSTLTGGSEYRQRLVGDYYQRFLHRPADASGLNAGLNFLNAGGSDEQYIATLTGSAEYFNNRGSANNNGFLDAIYFDLLGRTIDSNARANFLTQLGSGTTTTQVSTEVLSSSEYRGDLVTALFWRLLHRVPSGSDLSFYLNFLNSGATDEQLIANLAGSVEYFNVRSGGTATARASLVVSNLPPALSGLSISSPIVEGTSATLSGKLSGEGNSDGTFLRIDWGDGTSPQQFDLGLSLSFAFSHQYSNANPAYLVSVGVFEADDPGTNFQTLKLQVLSAPSRITSVTISKGLPILAGQGLAFHTYTIQATSDLMVWTSIGKATADSSGSFALEDSAPVQQRFYRVLSP